jgi:hypothetical protein
MLAIYRSQHFFHCWNASWNVLSVTARSSACALAQFSGCSSTTNAHSETGQVALCCQNLTLGTLSSRSALSLLVGALFKKFDLFFNTPRKSYAVVGNTMSSYLPAYEDGTVCSETLAYKIQKSENCPEERIKHYNLKFKIISYRFF